VRHYKLLAVAAIAVLAVGPFAAPASAATEVSRTEYVKAAEPICKADTEANRRIFKGAKDQVKAGELKRASAHFTRAATALGKAIKQLGALPQPPADEAKLTKWIGYLGAEQGLLVKIGKALGAEDKAGAQSLSVRLNRNSNLANNTVLAFGFEYCRIDPSRFSAK
jgi:hypothetical protein